MERWCWWWWVGELYHHKLCLLENPKQHSLVIALICVIEWAFCLEGGLLQQWKMNPLHLSMERNVNHIHKWKMIVACVHEDENKWYAAIELTMKNHWYFPMRIYGKEEEEIVSLLQLRVEGDKWFFSIPLIKTTLP